jgi:D-3-phosphoglycerate dehydrogenase
MIHVLYCGINSGFKIVQKALADKAKVVYASEEKSDVAEKLKKADVYFAASLKVPIDEKVLIHAKNLKLIVTATTNIDHIDTESLKKKNISFLSLKDDRAFLNTITSTAELAWLLLMACARKLSAAIAHTRDGGWDRDEMAGMMLRDRKLGVIGVGRLGTWMCVYAKAFGMEVCGYDSNPVFWPEGVQKVSMDRLLKSSDFITLHVAPGKDAYHMIGRKEIFHMKKGVILINTSRGGIVDEVALLEALNSGKVAAAGMDVLDGESDGNLDKHLLIEYSRKNHNLIITPHIGGAAPEALDKVLVFVANKIIKYFEIAI